MTIKCPNCAGALEFDPVTGLLMCEFCGSTFEPDSFNTEDSANYAKQVSPEEQSGYDQYNQSSNCENTQEETYQTNIYRCTSCGGEIAVNGVEASTFCAFCGQPTVIFDRVTDTLKPKLIIPFSVPKGKALQNINDRFKKGIFIPKEIKNYEIDKMRGIYIPYWLFDIYYYDNMTITAQKGSGKSRRKVTYHREADVTFHRMTLDASKNLNDDTSQRLEPFDIGDLKSFDIGYMTGYYADKYDMDVNSLRPLALSRATELFQKEVLSTCDGSSKKIVSSNPRIEFRGEEYALLPAWFMTFRYKDRPYTMLVNGQTGKVVGAVPYNKKKLWAFLVGLFFVLLGPSTYVGYYAAAVVLNVKDLDDILKALVAIIVGLIVICGITYKNFDSVAKSNELSSESKLKRFVKERQDRT